MFDAISAFFGRRPEVPAPPVVSLWDPKPASLHGLATCCHVRTAQGPVLGIAGQSVGLVSEQDHTAALIGIVPCANRQRLFLLAPDVKPFEIRGDGLKAAAVSAFVLQGSAPGALRLRHPLVPGRFMGVTQGATPGVDDGVTFTSLGESALDMFQLAPQPEEAVPDTVRAAAAELCAACARPMRADTLMHRIAAGQMRPELIEALLRVLPWDELAVLARQLMDSAEMLNLLSRLAGDTAWFSRVLPALAEWQRARHAVPGHRMVSPAADGFAAEPLEGFGHVQVGLALTALARRSVPPGRGACILACARNEGPYFVEWLAYHKSIGFEHAFIYTNDNSDGSDALLEALAAAGEITLVQNQAGVRVGPQYKAHAHALSLLPQILDYRWCLLLDLDEYFAFNSTMFSGVDDFLAWHETQAVDAIALCWQLFVAGRTDTWRDQFTPARLLRREAVPNPHVKSIFRPQKFWHSQPHFPYSTLGLPFFYRTETGALHHHPAVVGRHAAYAATPSANVAWINHYIVRTAQEALWKLARGYGDWSGQPAEIAEKKAEMVRFVTRSFVTLADKPDLVEDRRILACSQDMPPVSAALRALPGVGACEARIKTRFRAGLVDLTRKFIESPRRADEAGEITSFREVLEALPHMS